VYYGDTRITVTVHLIAACPQSSKVGITVTVHLIVTYHQTSKVGITVTVHLIAACPQSSTVRVIVSHEGTKVYPQLLLSCAAQAKTAFLQAV
jgi:hypothetical protein